MTNTKQQGLPFNALEAVLVKVLSLINVVFNSVCYWIVAEKAFRSMITFNFKIRGNIRCIVALTSYSIYPWQR